MEIKLDKVVIESSTTYVAENFLDQLQSVRSFLSSRSRTHVVETSRQRITTIRLVLQSLSGKLGKVSSLLSVPILPVVAGRVSPGEKRRSPHGIRLSRDLCPCDSKYQKQRFEKITPHFIAILPNFHWRWHFLEWRNRWARESLRASLTASARRGISWIFLDDLTFLIKDHHYQLLIRAHCLLCTVQTNEVLYENEHLRNVEFHFDPAVWLGSCAWSNIDENRDNFASSDPSKHLRELHTWRTLKPQETKKYFQKSFRFSASSML